jgi:C4-dicarboxylate-specific signal transduction histidine kinase
MDREQMLIGLSAAILAVALLLLVLAILHRRRLNQVSDQLAEGAVDNGETLKGVVERENDATRKHVSGAVDAMRHDTKSTKQTLYDFVDRQTTDSNEFRGQIRSIKDRVQHLITVADGLADRLRALPGQIKEWLVGPKEPPKP